MRFFVICVLSIPINTISVLLADICRYPDYNGRLTVSGKVELSEATNGIYLQYNFIGAVPNSIGGWHIHVGKSCSHDELVGGHYLTSSMVSDPWIPVTYIADKQGKAKGKIEMLGFTIAQIEGRTIVVHDPDGTRVGCGEIGPGSIKKGLSFIEMNYNKTFNKEPSFIAVATDPMEFIDTEPSFIETNYENQIDYAPDGHLGPSIIETNYENQIDYAPADHVDLEPSFIAMDYESDDLDPSLIQVFSEPLNPMLIQNLH